MALTEWKFRAKPEDAGARLDQYLFGALEKASDFTATGVHLSRSAVRRWILSGKVEINRRRLTLPARALGPTDEVSLFLDPAHEPRVAEVTSAPPPLVIVYEDADLVVVSKAAGLPTQPTLDPGRANLYQLLQAKYAAAPNPYVGLHHRLDRDTSGVILFTRRKEANPGIADAFKLREAKKIYLAIVHVPRGTRLATEWHVKNFLAKEGGKKGKMRAVRSGGDAASTRFRLIEAGRDTALVACFPETGRMHQIRVHLSLGGTPILGDATYNGPDRAGTVQRTMLHAANLALKHPGTGLKVSFAAPLPPDFLKCLHENQLSERKLPTNLPTLLDD